MDIDLLWKDGPRLIRDPDVFTLGTDAMLLSHFISEKRPGTLLDLGVGSGIIPLLAAWNDPELTAVGVEIQTHAAELAARNMELNGLSERVKIVTADMREWREPSLSVSFDLVVSNPPYFPAGSGRSALNPRIAIARNVIENDYIRFLTMFCAVYGVKGYGINAAALQTLRDHGNTLVISVDCGITAAGEAVFAREIGLDLVITDHHECRDCQIPDACAVIDPKRADDRYPNPELAGVGVAFKLICAISGDIPAMLDRYADLVAVGTISDVMPLTAENRFLVRRGLRKLEENPRPGFYAVMNEPGAAPRKPTAGYIGYNMAPRLNAAGRLGKTAKAVELLLTQDAEYSEFVADAKHITHHKVVHCLFSFELLLKTSGE